MSENAASPTWRVTHYKDRLVRARKVRACTVLGCSNVIQPGEWYVDVDPPERMGGYFAQCIQCAERRGRIEHATPDNPPSPEICTKEGES